MRTLTVRLDRETERQLAKLAQGQRRTLSNMARFILEEGVSHPDSMNPLGSKILGEGVSHPAR